jgi:hypothetical protein
MNGDAESGHRRRRRDRSVCDGGGQGRGRRKAGARGGEGSLGGRTTVRALVALGAYVAQDLRDREGLARPMLRRAALRMVTSRHEGVRRLGGAYLRGDSPAPEELATGHPAVPLLLAPGECDPGPGAPPPEPDDADAAV